MLRQMSSLRVRTNQIDARFFLAWDRPQNTTLQKIRVIIVACLAQAKNRVGDRVGQWPSCRHCNRFMHRALLFST